MTDDIVARLLECSVDDVFWPDERATFIKAAEEIERLRAEIARKDEALRNIANGEIFRRDGDYEERGYWGDVARAALAPTQEKDND